ncbi:sugar phosphate isomerase/epimerase [Marinilongibacter aquaticus]|uniref:sugar phosphate isomerase/epimerase family protein n=1 Tax=Marinilongibacter aquaticus TaxID=2975157 RepID=UPI0021BDBE05|nr:TIM barrel protein [Marinilongibacter aquaticus]UBM58284.1 sugar phosphate isomerase/epimerase [Marinilongibacter aquaticus]
MKSTVNRRKFLGAASALAGAAILPKSSVFGMPSIIDNFGNSGSKIKGVQIGVITYSFREMPDQSAEATLDYIRKSGITAIELMGGPAEDFAGAPKNTFDASGIYPLYRKRQAGEDLTAAEKKKLEDFQAARKAHAEELSQWRLKAPMQKFEEFRKMYNKAGIKIYAFKPSAFGKENSDAEIEYGMKAAKLLGASHVTLEHPSDDAHTLRLGKIGEKVGMKIGYHGHEQQTPTFWDTAIQQSPANGMNLDFGHFVAAGNANPVEFVQAKHEHIFSMHVKDRKTRAHGGANLPWGEGDTPIPAVLKLMQKNKYKFPATVELEYKIPEGSNSVEEVKKCLEFCKRALG